MNPLRIALVCHEYPPGKHGGIGTFTRNLARSMVAAGHEVRVIGSYATEPENEYTEDEGVRVWRLSSSKWRRGWISDRYRVFRRLRDWSRDGEIDAVELADWEGWAAGWPRLPVPVIVRLHGSATYFAAELGKQARFRTRFVERASLHRADYWCSVSRYAADRTRIVLGMQSEPDAIIYNSTALKQQRSVEERSKHDVMFTGTLTVKKGVVSLIKAWSAVARANSSAHLHVYGRDGQSDDGGSMQAYLASLIDEPFRGTVTFHGHQPLERILERLDNARLAVFPSYAEAFSIAPLESMACGCPTIYSQRGSGAELIDDGKDGLLVDPDKIEQISDSILRVLEDNDLASSLGEQGWMRVRDRFTTKRILADNESFYQHCVDDFAASKT